MLHHSIGSIVTAPFVYSPDLGPVGHGTAYFPGNVTEDMKALNFLGFLPDASFPTMSSTGSQGGDESQSAGAWDPAFRGAIGRFQTAARITADTWVGPQTRTALLAAVNAQNLQPRPPPAQPPSVPVNPGGVPAQPSVIPGVHPASAQAADDTLLYVGAGVGVLGLAALLWWALK